MEKRKIIPNALFFATVEEMVGEGRSVEMTVKGYSMRPFVRNERDVVVLSPIAAGELREGMILLFRYRGGHFLHRLHSVEGGRLVMEGDGNYRQSEIVGVQDVVAYVSEVKLDGGRGLRYGTVRWRCRTMLSLGRKRLRTLLLDLKHKKRG